MFVSRAACVSQLEPVLAAFLIDRRDRPVEKSRTQNELDDCDCESGAQLASATRSSAPRRWRGRRWCGPKARRQPVCQRASGSGWKPSAGKDDGASRREARCLHFTIVLTGHTLSCVSCLSDRQTDRQTGSALLFRQYKHKFGIILLRTHASPARTPRCVAHTIPPTSERPGFGERQSDNEPQQYTCAIDGQQTT